MTEAGRSLACWQTVSDVPLEHRSQAAHAIPRLLLPEDGERGLAGRAIASLDPAKYSLGTSDEIVDPRDDFTVGHFRVLGSYERVVSGAKAATLSSITDPAVRSAHLSALGISQASELHVIYLFPRVSRSSSFIVSDYSRAH